VLLVHGYNNTPKIAERSYRNILEKLGLPPHYAVWQLLWPSTHPLGAISLATYPARVPAAENCGWLVAEKFISTLGRERTVYIVAHSLGCRLVLDAIKWIREHPSPDLPHIAGVFLLAAAVPVRMCVLHGEAPFRRPLPNSKEYVFYSGRDFALSVGFRPGQYLLGDPNERGPAVGRHGHPSVGRWNGRKGTKLGHSSYWRSETVAGEIKTILGIRTTTVLESSELASHELDEASGPAARALPERHIGS